MKAFAAILMFTFSCALAQTGGNGEARLLSIEGRVEVSPGPGPWAAARTNQLLAAGDRIRTGVRSRAALQLSDASVLRLNELTTLEIRPPKTNAPGSFEVRSGSTYFFNRERPAKIQFRTPIASGAIRGTEVSVRVGDDGRTEIVLLEGAVDVSNEQGQVSLAPGDQATVNPGQAPVRTAVLNASAAIQWALYYPAVLNVDDANLSPDERNALDESVSAYNSGDLLLALASYPEARQPISDGEKIYRAATLLAVGQVDAASALLGDSPLALSVKSLIAIVTGQRLPSTRNPLNATEWIVESYRLQSQSDLNGALAAARNAVRLAPQFGFGWSRVAELEFSFGRTHEAQKAIARSLAAAPRNAEAQAINGFLFAARGKYSHAARAFDEAIEIDPALGNAWLGRGLVNIRQGRVARGQADLQAAAALEPQRSLTRSYLAKAWSHLGDTRRADKEIGIAQRLDPHDPTAWLYSALIAFQQNRINDAISDLERSQELNENRSIFRSRLLLDEDRAVRSANLARLYADAGMTDWSWREASRAVSYDYGNFSAHQFLANSYDALRDPAAINLRYEAPAVSEYFIASLLAPIGATPLSPTVSQQEYTRLFDRDRIGIASSTEYFSNGDWIQRGSQYGVQGGFEWALDADYISSNGQRPNNDFESLELTLRLKQQITPQDTLYFEAQRNDFESGDVVQYYDQRSGNRDLRVEERQQPNLFVGYHHEWSPGNKTLALAGRLEDVFGVNGRLIGLEINRTPDGTVFNSNLRPFDTYIHSEIEAYTAELQQIMTLGAHTLVAGVRGQTADLESRQRSILTPGAFPGPFVYPRLVQEVDGDLHRFSAYAYDMWRIVETLQLTAGVAYDILSYPDNHDIPPFTEKDSDRSQVSPKAGLIWTPVAGSTFRGAYTRSLGGVFFDNSYRLEPTLVGGLNQAYRSLVPESVVGTTPGTRFETLAVGYEQKLPTRTYLTVGGEILESTSRRSFGAYNRYTDQLVADPTTASADSEYRERALVVALNQLVGELWAFGARYRVTDAELDERFSQIPPGLGVGALPAKSDLEGLLQQVHLYGTFNTALGFFTQAEAVFSRQDNDGYSPALSDEDFWQLNAFVGYRFWQRRAEAKVGILNITDKDYRLNPLTLYSELPRERTFYASFKFYF